MYQKTKRIIKWSVLYTETLVCKKCKEPAFYGYSDVYICKKCDAWTENVE